MLIRKIKIMFAVAVGIWGLWGGIGNLLGYEGGYGAVKAVLSMSTLSEPAAYAITNSFLIHLGFAFIWLTKLTGGTLCLLGAKNMWADLETPRDDFQRAKSFAIAGCAIILFMLFFGFNFIAANVFMLYQSPMISAVELSWIFAGEIGLILIFLNMRD